MTGSPDESFDLAQVGETVRWHRQANQLTQAQLGELMAQAGFPWHKSTVSKTESGQRDTTVRELIALARIFEVSASALVSMPATALHYQESLQTQATVPEARPPAASLIDHEDKRIAKAAQKVMAAEAALDAAWEANAEKAALRAKRDKLKKQLAEIEAQLKGAAPMAADPKKIRSWAAEQGYEVAASGQIPKAIMADYLDATSGGAA